MASQADKEKTKEILLKVGQHLKGTEGGSRFVVVRCANLEEVQTVAGLLPRAFPKIRWASVPVAIHGLEPSLEKAAEVASAGKAIPILYTLTGEDTDRCLDAGEAKVLEARAAELKLLSLPIVLVVLAPSVRVLVQNAPVLWEGKGGYLAWPSEPPEVLQQDDGAIGTPHLDDGEEPPPPEETRKVLEQLEGDSAADYLIAVSERYLQTGSLEQARMFLLRAVQIYSETANLKGMAMAYHLLGVEGEGRGDYDTAIEWFDQAIDNRRILDDQEGLSESFGHKGYSHYLKGEYERATRAFDEAIKIDEELGLKSRVSAGYRKIAMVMELKGDYHSAEELYNRSLVIEEELGNPKGMARVYHHLGRLKEESGSYDEAVTYHTSSVELKEQEGDTMGLATSNHQLGNLALKKGEFEEAIAFYEKALDQEREIGDRQGLARTGAQLGLAFRETGQIEKALYNLVKAYRLLQKLRSPLASEVLGKVEEIQDLVTVEVFNKILREASLSTSVQ